jgi:hypothetical protein
MKTNDHKTVGPTDRNRNVHRIQTLSLALLLAAVAGCSNSPPPRAPTPAAQTTPAETPSEKPAQSQPASDPRGGELLDQAKVALGAGRTADARALLEQVRQLDGLSESEQEQLADLDAQLAALIEAENETERDAGLQRVPDLIANGKLDDAADALETASVRKPTDEQREQIAEFRQ